MRSLNSRGFNRILFGLILVVFLGPALLTQEQRIKVYTLSEMDLFCCFYINEGDLPEIRIVGAVLEEKTLLSDRDEIFLDKGRDAGLETGQVYTVVSLAEPLGPQGTLVYRRSLARILSVFDTKAMARLERTCDSVQIGDWLVSHIAREPLEVREEALTQVVFADDLPAAGIVFLQDGLVQVGTGHLVLIDQGMEEGLSLGQQLAIFRTVREGFPPRVIGNSIVISVGTHSATLRLLTCRDTVQKGDLVQRHVTIERRPN